LTTASKKAKGRALQKLAVVKLLSVSSRLQKGDIRSTAMGQAGEDVQLSPLAQEVLGPLYIEAKNVEKLNIISVFQETTKKAGSRIPVVIHKRNKVEPVVILSLDYWIELLKKINEKEKNIN